MANEIIDTPEHIAIIEKLATGYIIRCEDLGGFDGNRYYLERDERKPPVRMWDIERLGQLGFVESFPGGYRITDAGRAAYVKSTDEMGDGKIHTTNKDKS